MVEEFLLYINLKRSDSTSRKSEGAIISSMISSDANL